MPLCGTMAALQTCVHRWSGSRAARCVAAFCWRPESQLPCACADRLLLQLYSVQRSHDAVQHACLACAGRLHCCWVLQRGPAVLDDTCFWHISAAGLLPFSDRPPHQPLLFSIQVSLAPSKRACRDRGCQGWSCISGWAPASLQKHAPALKFASTKPAVASAPLVGSAHASS